MGIGSLSVKRSRLTEHARPPDPPVIKPAREAFDCLKLCVKLHQMNSPGEFRDDDIPQAKGRTYMNGLTRGSFASKAFARIAALGMVARLSQSAEAQLVWSTSEWTLATFEGLLHEKARVKQLFDITRVEDGASLAKVKNSLNGLHYRFGVPVDLQTVLSLEIPHQRTAVQRLRELTKQVPGSLIQGNRDNSDPTARLHVEAVGSWSVPKCFRGATQMGAPHEPQVDTTA
jgi:hypothetical protein